eukprot:3058071-Lingulodinium_polyedra.AAC.1
MAAQREPADHCQRQLPGHRGRLAGRPAPAPRIQGFPSRAVAAGRDLLGQRGDERRNRGEALGAL